MAKHTLNCVGKLRSSLCRCGYEERLREERDAARRALIARYADKPSRDPRP